MTLGEATRAVERADCRLGRIQRPRKTSRHHLLRVVSQSARAGSSHPPGYKVNVVVE
jgi:hypothetical protein